MTVRLAVLRQAAHRFRMVAPDPLTLSRMRLPQPSFRPLDNSPRAPACEVSDDDCTWTVLKSRDGGENWAPAIAGLPSGVPLLVMDPQDASTLYATAIVPGANISGKSNWTQTKNEEGQRI